jgi:hypothetical protein
VEYSDLPPITPRDVKRTPYFLEALKDHSYEQGNFAFFFPAGTFYDDFYVDFDVKDNMLLINSKNIPVHKSFNISVKDTGTAEADRMKTFIATYSGTRPAYNETWYKDGAFNTKVKVLGKFGLAKDTLAPRISVAKSIEGKWLSKQKTLEVFIRDDLSGIKKYDCYINGKWALFEYNYKSGKLTHNFSDNIYTDGKNELKVIVSDNVGNSAIFETSFFRSQQ